MALASLDLSVAQHGLSKDPVCPLTFACISSGSSRLINPRILNLCNAQKTFRVILISVADLEHILDAIFCDFYRLLQMEYLALFLLLHLGK